MSENKLRAVPQKFVTTDGTEFKDESAALKYQRVLDAKAKFDAAQRKLTIALAETHHTADGYPFSFDAWQYYHVTRRGFAPPELETVSFYAWDVHVDGHSLLSVRSSANGQPQSYPFRSLYRERKNAVQALHDELDRWLAELTEHVARAKKHAS